MGKLQDWSAGQEAWVRDALRRAALAESATAVDADAVAARVQAANGIAAVGEPECMAFDEECLAPVGAAADVELLCSIGPLDHIDRLTNGQELKFALDGLTIIFGENGSGKSGYARAARRLCTSRIPCTLQGNVFEEGEASPTVTFKVRTGNAEPVSHQWAEGSALPDCCREMSFLDTAKAKKATVLSEGEQRALAIACFLADAHVSASRGAIILDDPVTSLDHQRIRRVANRFAGEAARGRQVIIFTHNLLFYQEVLRACADRDPQVSVLPCLIQQSREGFGLVSVDDQPWIAKKVKERERALEEQLRVIPDDLAPDGEEMRLLATQFCKRGQETAID